VITYSFILLFFRPAMNFIILSAKTLKIRMLQKIIFSAIFSLFVFCSIAQNRATYFIYKVRKGETFRSIASKYNLTAQKLAYYNNLDFYEGKLTAKTLRIPKKSIKGDSITNVKLTPNDISNKVGTQDPSTKRPADDTFATSPAPPGTNTQTSTSPIAIVDTASQEIEAEIEQPTLKSDISKHLSLILFLSVSLLLLAGAIAYYRMVNRK
jgi:LysM repeat protein